MRARHTAGVPDFEIALHRLQRWDADWSLRANRSLRGAGWVALFRAVSRLGDGIGWYALMLGLMILHGADAALPVLHMIVTGLACSAIYKALKHGTARPRPCDVQYGVDALSPALDRFSFPSGHTLHAVGFTLVACAYWPALAVVLVPFTALVAASRLVLGLHYPSDVIVGALLGTVVAGLSVALA